MGGAPVPRHELRHLPDLLRDPHRADPGRPWPVLGDDRPTHGNPARGVAAARVRAVRRARPPRRPRQVLRDAPSRDRHRRAGGSGHGVARRRRCDRLDADRDPRGAAFRLTTAIAARPGGDRLRADRDLRASRLDRPDPPLRLSARSCSSRPRAATATSSRRPRRAAARCSGRGTCGCPGSRSR